MSTDRRPPARPRLKTSASLLLCAATLGAQTLDRLVPLGLPLPPALEAHRATLPSCAADLAPQTACRENVSLAGFRLALTIPAGILDYFPAGFIPLAVESETAPEALAPQTPDGFVRAHLRRFDAKGNPDPRAISVPLAPVLPLEIWKKARLQSAANEFASAWILTISDPRGSESYVWPEGADKAAAGCLECERPRWMDEVTVFEIRPGGRSLRVRVDLSDEERDELPPHVLAQLDTLVIRFNVIPADLVRNATTPLAGANPPTDGFRMEHAAMLHTREIAFSSTDLGVRARNTAIEISRVYSSALAHFGPFGRNLDSPLFARIRALPDGSVELYDGTGRRDRFLASEGGYVAPPGVFLDVKSRPEGGWVVLGRSNGKVLFDRDGRLERILDPNVLAGDGSDGNVTRFLYDDGSRLRSIVDPVGREIRLEYHDSLGGGAYPGLIASIVDFDGREIRYSYDEQGKLTVVEGPDPKSASSGTPRTLYEWGFGASGQIVRERDALNREVWSAEYEGTSPWASSIMSGEGTWQLASSGATTTVTDPNGGERTFVHDFAGRVVSIEDDAGATSSFTYDSAGRLVESVQPMGERTTYAYHDAAPEPRHRANLVEIAQHPRPETPESEIGSVRTTHFAWQNGLLVSTTSPDGATQAIGRDARGNPVAITDPAGLVTTNVYDSRGLLVSTSDPRSGTTSFAYETSDPTRLGNLESVTTAAGTTTLETDARGNVVAVTDPAGRAASFTYNALDQLEREEREASESQIAYDATGAITERRTLRAFGEGGEPLWQSGAWSVDAQGRLESAVEDGVTTSWTYDAAGNTTQVVRPGTPATEYAYDALGRIAALEIGSRKTTYEYDLNGQSTAVTDALGRTTHFLVDGFGSSVGTVDAAGIRTIDRHDDAGRPVDSRVVKTLPDGSRLLLRWTVREFDVLGRLVKEMRKLFDNPLPLPADGSDPAGATDVVSETIYDDAARTVTQIDPRGAATRSEMDAIGRLTRVIDPMGNTLEFTYDPSGNRISETMYEADAENVGQPPSSVGQPPSSVGQPPSAARATEPTTSTQYSYDNQNRLIAVRDVSDPDRPLVTLYTYDVRGNLTRILDPERRETHIDYDARGRRTRVVDAEGAETALLWDPLDRLIGMIDANGNETAWIWDAQGRLEREIRADGATWFHTYDVQGHRNTVTDPNGTVTTYHRDALDRLVALTMDRAEGVEGPSSVTYVLDDLGRIVSSVTDEGVQTTAGWDSLDRMLFEGIAIADAPERRVARAFDAGGLPVAVRYPSGLELHRTFDALGRLAEVTCGADCLLARYHDEGLRQTSRESGNGITDSWTWDANHRLARIESRAPCGLAAGCDPFRTIDYVRSAGGAKLEVLRPDLALRTRYGLDRLDRITTVTREILPDGAVQDHARFTLDEMLNLRATERLGEPALATEVNERNQITAVGTEELEWDANGNLVARDGLELAYDASNRLVRARLGDGTAIDTLRDAFGRKVRETLTFAGTARATEFAYDGQRILEEYVAGNLAVRYAHGRGIDELLRAELSTALDGTLDRTLWPLQDELATVDALTDSAGAIVHRLDYAPWGAPIDPPDFRFQFQGRDWSPHLRAHDYRARTLFPDLARFAQEDPAGLTDHANPYQALLGNWTTATDPEGDVVVLMHGILSTAEWAQEMADGLRDRWSVDDCRCRDAHQDVVRLVNRTDAFKRFGVVQALKAGTRLRTLNQDTLQAGDLTANFLHQIRAHLDASDGHKTEPLNLIAHSHGTAIVLAAARQSGERLNLGHVIFAGSDLDINTDIDSILQASQDFTNYWSPEDGVLYAIVAAGYSGFLDSNQQRLTDFRQIKVAGVDHFTMKWEERAFFRQGWMSYRMAYNHYADKVAWVRDPELPGETESWLRSYLRIRSSMALGDQIPLSFGFR